ncbi:hypothetical protein ACFQ0H_07980 [Lysobacter gummosus]|uniref:hypothetical protein n=1 Tax=Lysobacter gummosus TaxID=262324 RepID=UPI003640D697
MGSVVATGVPSASVCWYLVAMTVLLGQLWSIMAIKLPPGTRSPEWSALRPRSISNRTGIARRDCTGTIVGYRCPC